MAMTQSFDKLATITVSTKRPPAIAGGKRGSPVTYISSLACTPLVPVAPEVLNRMNLDTPFEGKETYVFSNADVVEGDFITYNSTDYRVVGVAEWPVAGETFLHVLLEEDK